MPFMQLSKLTDSLTAKYMRRRGHFEFFAGCCLGYDPFYVAAVQASIGFYQRHVTDSGRFAELPLFLRTSNPSNRCSNTLKTKNTQTHSIEKLLTRAQYKTIRKTPPGKTRTHKKCALMIISLQSTKPPARNLKKGLTR
jgi:hypothetical protein